MTAWYRSEGDQEGLQFWSYILDSLNLLTYEGMSDEETGFDEDSGESLKFVLKPLYRHEDFGLLFKYVDSVPASYPDLFHRTGTKRWKRVATPFYTAREAPTHLPSSFYRDGY
ncbi:hypothetical protein EV361DRAFT_764199, partial [Lentinula raphanica]